jgi:hypothetical protein
MLLLDLGLKKSEIMKAIDYNVSDVEGAIVSHCHSDHSKALKDFQRMGMPIFAPYLTDGEPIWCKLGKFYVKAFELPHNGTVNYGMFIQIDGQKILYMTDYEYCHFNFAKLEINHFLVECNYQKELVNKDLANYEHKIRGHSSLDYCKQFLSDNITNSARNVILVHLGAGTTIPSECMAEVKKVAGNANVYVAERGLTVDLSEIPF